MNWFMSIVRIAGVSFPVASSLVQLQAELDAHAFAERLKRLEDPISYLHSDVRGLSERLYAKVKDRNSSRIELEDADHERYDRALAILDSQHLITLIRALGVKHPRGLRITDPSYLLYMCALFDESGAMDDVYKAVDTCKRGQRLDGRTLAKKHRVPLPVVEAVFEVYEQKGYGLRSREVNSAVYPPAPSKQGDGPQNRTQDFPSLFSCAV
jgi:hypothetical protein